MLNGLSVINIELTSMCNKNCWMCGRRKVDKEYPEIKMNYGDIDKKLLYKLSNQVPSNIIIQFHKDGDPLLYSNLKYILSLFSKNIRCFNTNGKLLMNKADDIIDNLETITISTFENDPEWEEQYSIIKEFLKYKQNRLPTVIIRTLGEYDTYRMQKYKELQCLIADRVLHSPMGSFTYTKKTTVPEHGICLDLLSHLTVDRFGNVYSCVRFDPHKESLLGNLNESSLDEIWNSRKRQSMIDKFIHGKRSEIEFCSKCEFWGIPRGN